LKRTTYGDVVVLTTGKRIGFELKRAGAHSLTRSMRIPHGEIVMIAGQGTHGLTGMGTTLVHSSVRV
jgi:hypothetical protein